MNFELTIKFIEGTGYNFTKKRFVNLEEKKCEKK
jgi:hypothetical protein